MSWNTQGFTIFDIVASRLKFFLQVSFHINSYNKYVSQC